MRKRVCEALPCPPEVLHFRGASDRGPSGRSYFACMRCRWRVQQPAPCRCHVVLEELGARMLGARHPHLASGLDGVLGELVLANACPICGVCRVHLSEYSRPDVIAAHFDTNNTAPAVGSRPRGSPHELAVPLGRAEAGVRKEVKCRPVLSGAVARDFSVRGGDCSAGAE